MFLRKKSFNTAISKIYKSINFNKEESQKDLRDLEKNTLLPIMDELLSLKSRIKQLEERK